MKQKKKNQIVNNKFNFDDEYIIGFSDSKNLANKKKDKNLSVKKKKKKAKNSKPKNNYKSSRPKMNDKKKRIRVRLTRIILLMCLLVGTICFLCLSPMFNIQEIVVEQNSKIASDTIASLSGIQL